LGLPQPANSIVILTLLAELSNMSAIYSDTYGMTPVTLAKAIQFNNAGVSCFRSHPKKAWELFKGALEIKLAMEKEMNSSCECSVKVPFYEQLSSENAYIYRAHTILEEGGDEVADQITDRGEVTLDVVEASRTLLSSTLCKRLGKELGDIFYTPFVFSRSFRIPDDFESIPPIELARTTSAIVIFNLALVEHLFNRTSPQAVSLYELATSLLVGQSVNELGLALINNIGVWCYENDDNDAAQRCMDHLSKILRNPSCRDLITASDRDAVLRNICCMLMPRGTTSPAA
jgi:hypothetical protein